MDAAALVRSLERFPAALRGALENLAPDELRWRPAGGWSTIEICGHLVEEERADFRDRIERTLRDPREEWPPIDPERAVREGAYQDGDVERVLAAFFEERARSLAWLRGLAAPEWSRAHDHPSLGTLRAGDLLASWAAHDLLHLRQIVRRAFERLEHDAGEWSTAYAGRW